MRARSAGAVALLMLLAFACRGSGRGRQGEARKEEQAPPPGQEPTDASLPSKTVKLYFPSSEGESLVIEEREIYETASPVDRAKQILAELLDGPKGGSAVSAVPRGTTLKQVYVLADGTAYANFSSSLSVGIDGSSDEILAIYSIVDSLALNVPEIKRVAILVDGRGKGTLAGHIDIRRPFRPDRAAG